MRSLKQYRCTVLLFITNIFFMYQYFTNRGMPCSDSNIEYCIADLNLKVKLAHEVLNVQRQISHSYKLNGPIDAIWSITLLDVAKQLDTRIPDYGSQDWGKSGYLSSMVPPKVSLTGKPRHVCPQIFNNSIEDDPFFQHGFQFIKCDYVPPLRKVITFIILFSNELDKVTNDNLLDRIQNIYDVDVILLNKNKIFRTKSNSESSLINEAIEKVTTPYVFIGQHLSNFDNQTSIERLIAVLDDLENDGVVVAGGSVRNRKGYWIHGCVQSKVANYRVKYKLGYFYSRHECMFCDDILSPFVVSTKILKKFKLSIELNNLEMFRDWFIRLRNAGFLAVACPDVMFHVSQHQIMSRNEWLTISKMREFVELEIEIFNHQIKYEFSCAELNIKCKSYWNDYIKKGLFAPLCCIKIFRTFTTSLIQYFEKKKVYYELGYGTGLGAIKFEDIFPWDVDGDISFFNDDWDKVKGIKNEKCHNESKNIYSSVYDLKEYHYFVITHHETNFFIDFTTRPIQSTKFMAPEFHDQPTLVLFCGIWAILPANPGLYMRNVYKFDYLRHAIHWRLHNQTKIDKEISDQYVPPNVNSLCQKPGHHSCRDKYSVDGSIPIFSPFW